MLGREVRVYRQLVWVNREEVDPVVLEECGLDVPVEGGRWPGLPKRVPVLGPPKGRKGREVEVSDDALEAISEHLAAGYAPDTFHLPVLGQGRGKSTDARLLFQSRREGGPLRDASVRSVLTSSGKRLGLPGLTGPHVFRHYYASVQLAAGRSTLEVSRQLGHKDDSLVSSTYAHLFPEAKSEARAASAGAWAQARADREAARRRGLRPVDDA
jgi:integrase